MTLNRFEKLCRRLYGEGELIWGRVAYWNGWIYQTKDGQKIPFGVVVTDRRTRQLCFVNGFKFMGTEKVVMIFEQSYNSDIRVGFSAKDFSLSERELYDCYVIRRKRNSLYFERV